MTGASGGIGAAIATAVGKSGATVALHANFNLHKIQNKANNIGNKSRIFQSDLVNAEEAIKLVQHVIAHFGRLDVVINNAGIAINSAPDGASQQWLQDWNETMNVNLTATAVICREAINYFLQKEQEGILIGDTKNIWHMQLQRAVLSR